MPISRWFEHFFILPIRWYKKNIRNWREQSQRCKICGNADKLNFNIEDSIWMEVVPTEFQNRVVCLSCFDDLAKKKGVEYSTALNSVYFAGDNAAFRFIPTKP